MKSSATDASTKTLDAAEHFWPAKLNALRPVPAAARSRSAAAVTITGFLPPISQIAGFGYADANERMIAMPTALDPVNVTPSTPGCRTRAAPVSAPPVTRFTTPGGTPAATRASYTR